MIKILIFLLLFISSFVFSSYPERCMPTGYVKGKATWHLFIMPYTKMEFWILKLDRNGRSISCKGE